MGPECTLCTCHYIPSHQVLSYPSSSEVTAHLTELEQELFFFVANKEAGRMDGYYVNNERDSPSSSATDFHTTHLWHITFPQDSEKIVSVVPKAIYGMLAPLITHHS